MPFAVTRKVTNGPPDGPPGPAGPADGAEMPEEAARSLDRGPQLIFPKKLEAMEVIHSRGRSVQISQLWLRS